MTNLNKQEEKKCLSIRFNLSYLLAVFLLFICSIANAMYEAPYTVGIPYKGIDKDAQAYCTDPSVKPAHFDFQEVTWTAASGTQTGGDATYVFMISPQNSGRLGMCKATNNNSYGTYIYDGQACVVVDGYQIDNGIMSCGSCPAGYEPVNGKCVPPSECPSAGTQAAASAGWITTGNVSGSLSISSGLCTNNSPSGDLCQAKCNSGVVGRNPVTGESRLECSSYTFTGNQCEPSDISSVASPTPEIGVNGNNNAPPENPDDCPPGTGFAQINNTKTCLPGGSEFTDGSTVKTDTTTTTTKTTTTVINSDGTTTSTTTINVTNPEGGLIGSGTSTSTSGMDQAGSDKGKEFDPGPVPIIDTSLPAEGTIPTHTFTNPVFDTNLFQVAGACPAPIAFEAMGQSFSIEFDPICDLSPIIRGIILMLAAIIAIRVVVTG